MNRRIIYVIGYPRSGTTWLARLLATALNCPLGGVIPQFDADRELSSEGWDRPGLYVVRKGHCILADRKGGPVIQERGRYLCWRNLTDEPVIFIFRDPRDVAVSCAFHGRGIPVWASVRQMSEQKRWVHAPWQDYVNTWLDASFPYIQTSYEALSEDACLELARILYEAGLSQDDHRVAHAVASESFAARRLRIMADGDKLSFGRDYHLKFLRKGTVGDWRNYFGPDECRKAEEHWGPLMRRLGYTEDANWLNASGAAK